jgi:UDP-2,3-diacylglucosamine hydrolase
VTVWFASDLHLDPSTPEIAARFHRFLDGPVQGARSLFLLGDLFEAWIGDDDPEPAHREVIARLAALAASGTLVYVMRGNRDFMLGDRFCREAGATLLDDPAILTVADERIAISHGDGLCIDDRAYQKLRALVRDPALRAGFARLPIDARRRLASEAREGSREHLANAGNYITDVNPAAVETVFRGAGVGVMIHGHTHRPGVHRLPVDGRERTRVVLGAWHDDANVVRWDDAGWQLIPCPA